VTTLKDIKPGQSATVTKINSEGALRRRILDMGITRGVTIKVIKVAPLGDPIEMSVRGYKLSLRKDDAKNILVEPMHPCPAELLSAETCTGCHKAPKSLFKSKGQ